VGLFWLHFEIVMPLLGTLSIVVLLKQSQGYAHLKKRVYSLALDKMSWDKLGPFLDEDTMEISAHSALTPVLLES
jgi:hypothetical protein